jgi:hypothetical protein
MILGMLSLTFPGDPIPLTWQRPRDPTILARCWKTTDWIDRHTRRVDVSPLFRREEVIEVVAWKDPTLHPEKPDQLAGYLITDTLWSAHAVAPFRPDLAERILRGLERVHGLRNRLHEVLFEPTPEMWHAPDDIDFMHGHSLGVFPSTPPVSVDVRVFRHRVDPAFDAGHPSLFAEHAVYRSLHEFWKEQTGPATARLRAIIEPKADAIIRWDAEHSVLVDQVHLEEWRRWKQAPQGSFRHYTFKGALLLYAMKVLKLDEEYPAVAKQLSQRTWSAQNPDGGVGHFVDIDKGGSSTPAPDATGEACAISILAETVVPTAREN